MEVQVTVEVGPRRGSVHALRPGETLLVGRGPGAGLALDAPGLAARHVAVIAGPAGVQVVDLGGGTLLDGRPLALRTPIPVRAGSDLTLGPVVLRLEVFG